MVDVKVCRSTKNIPELGSDQYDQFKLDIQEEARKQVFKSEKKQ